MTSRQLFFVVLLFLVFSPPTLLLLGLLGFFGPDRVHALIVVSSLILLVSIVTAFVIGRRFGKPAIIAPAVSIMPIVAYLTGVLSFRPVDVVVFVAVPPVSLIFCGLLAGITFIGVLTGKKSRNKGTPA